MRSMIRSTPAQIVCATVISCLTGCGSVPAIPESFDVAISTTEKATANVNTGPEGLLGITLSLSRPAPTVVGTEPRDTSNALGPYGGILSGQGLTRPPEGEEIFQVAFLGENAAMSEVTRNRFFLSQFYGETIPVGGGWISTTLPGVSYKSASYGVQQDGRFGSTVVVHVRLGNLYVGKAILYSWGGITGEQPSNVTFGYLLDFTGGLLEFVGKVADQYSVVATIVSEAP